MQGVGQLWQGPTVLVRRYTNVLTFFSPPDVVVTSMVSVPSPLIENTSRTSFTTGIVPAVISRVPSAIKVSPSLRVVTVMLPGGPTVTGIVRRFPGAYMRA